MMKTKLKNKESKKQMLNLYFQKLDDLALTYELRTVETSFGDTNIITVGDNKNPPLILVHGFYSSAPFALEMIRGLEKHFKIYAVDILGEPNLSETNSEVLKSDDYAKWMYEILSRLQIYNANFIGISLGGFIGLKSLVLNSMRFKKAFFINPTGIVNCNSLNITAKILLPNLYFKLFKKDKYIKKIQKRVSMKDDVFTFNYLKTLLSYHKLNSIFYHLISRQEAKSITTSLYIIASEDGLIYSGKKVLRKAKEIFPSLEEVVLLPKTKHFLSKKQYKSIINYIFRKINS